MKNKRAIVIVNFDGLAEILFGKGTVIYNAKAAFDDYGDSTIEFALEHPSLKEIEEGLKLPRMVAVINVEDNVRSIEFKEI